VWLKTLNISNRMLKRHRFQMIFVSFFHPKIRAYPSRSAEQELLGAARHAANFVARS